VCVCVCVWDCVCVQGHQNNLRATRVTCMVARELPSPGVPTRRQEARSGLLSPRDRCSSGGSTRPSGHTRTRVTCGDTQHLFETHSHTAAPKPQQWPMWPLGATPGLAAARTGCLALCALKSLPGRSRTSEADRVFSRRSLASSVAHQLKFGATTILLSAPLSNALAMP
jgi:hypothetical protein